MRIKKKLREIVRNAEKELKNTKILKRTIEAIEKINNKIELLRTNTAKQLGKINESLKKETERLEGTHKKDILGIRAKRKQIYKSISKSIKKLQGRVETNAQDVASVRERASKAEESINRILSIIEKIEGAEDGYTPEKGKDYFTEEEIEEIKKIVTPTKGFDYFTKSEIKKFKKDVTPKKGVDYFDGKDGKKVVKEIVKEIEKLDGIQIVDKLEDLEGEDRLDAKALKNLPSIVVQGGKKKITELENITDIENRSHTDLTEIGEKTHEEIETDLEALENMFLVDTKENILDTIGSSGRIALATDTKRLYVYDGTDWNESAIVLTSRDGDPDMGYADNSALTGYGEDYVTDKQLSNVLIGGNNREENGALRIDVTENPDTLEIFLRGIWQTLLYDLTYEDGDFRHTPLSEEIYVWRGDSVALGLNGRPIISEYQIGMGAFPPARILTGGSF